MRRLTVVGIGEILWDLFPTGPRFGGAPANFVCGVAQLAGDRTDALMASGVGRDDLGRAPSNRCMHTVSTRIASR